MKGGCSEWERHCALGQRFAAQKSALYLALGSSPPLKWQRHGGDGATQLLRGGWGSSPPTLGQALCLSGIYKSFCSGKAAGARFLHVFIVIKVTASISQHCSQVSSSPFPGPGLEQCILFFFFSFFTHIEQKTVFPIAVFTRFKPTTSATLRHVSQWLLCVWKQHHPRGCISL